MKFLTSSFLIVLINLFGNAQSLLQSGPMLGYTDLRETAIWVQTTEKADVRIDYWLKEKPALVFSTETLETESTAHTSVLIADNIEPGNTYVYKLFINNKEVVLPYLTEFQTQPVWKWRNDPPDFSLAAGSGTYINEKEYDRPGKPYGGEYEIFQAIHSSSPDFMIWLGDNAYLREPDWNTWTGIVKRWTHTRSIKEMQPLLASTHHYAIWDDHDYGPNNSDRGFWNKNSTLEAFKLFWANPSYGIGDIEGVITQFQWNDVDFILLDNRFYRSPNLIQEKNKTILGDKQKQWLKDALISSSGSFKIIVMGGQFLNDAGNHEVYSANGFNAERQEIIDFIYAHNIKNVVFLTGDRHHSELSVLEEHGKPRIIDITFSALTSGAANNKDEKNSYRVENTYTNKRNYGLISFSGPLKQRKMNIETRDSQGSLIWKKEYIIESNN